MYEIQKRTSGLAVASLIIGLFCLIPLLGGILFSLPAVVLGIVAIVKISQNKETIKGLGLAVSGIVMGAVGVLMIPIIALVAAIAIPNFLKAKTSAQDAAAQSRVSTIASAFEAYAVESGMYPFSEQKLLTSEPPYLDQAYNGQTISGYVYRVQTNPQSFHIMAEPEECEITGTKIITFDSGIGLDVRECLSSHQSD